MAKIISRKMCPLRNALNKPAPLVMLVSSPVLTDMNRSFHTWCLFIEKKNIQICLERRLIIKSKLQKWCTSLFSMKSLNCEYDQTFNSIHETNHYIPQANLFFVLESNKFENMINNTSQMVWLCNQKCLIHCEFPKRRQAEQLLCLH